MVRYLINYRKFIYVEKIEFKKLYGWIELKGVRDELTLSNALYVMLSRVSVKKPPSSWIKRF